MMGDGWPTMREGGYTLPTMREGGYTLRHPTSEAQHWLGRLEGMVGMAGMAGPVGLGDGEMGRAGWVLVVGGV